MSYERCRCQHGLGGPVEDFVNWTQKTVSDAGDRAARDLCRIIPLDEVLNKVPYLDVVIKFSHATAPLQLMLMPFGLPFFLAQAAPTLMLDIARTCKVSTAVKNAAVAYAIDAKVCEILIPFAPTIVTLVGAAMGGVPAVAGPLVASGLTMGAGTYDFWMDIAAGNVRPSSVAKVFNSTGPAVLNLVSLGLMNSSASGVPPRAQDSFKRVGELMTSAQPVFDAAKDAAKAKKSVDQARSEIQRSLGTATKPGPLGRQVQERAKNKSTRPSSPSFSSRSGTLRTENTNGTGAFLLAAGAGVAAVAGAPIALPAILGGAAVLSLLKKD